MQLCPQGLLGCLVLHWTVPGGFWGFTSSFCFPMSYFDVSSQPPVTFPAFLAALPFVLQFSEFLQNHVSKPVKILSKGSHSRLWMKAWGTFLWIKNMRFPRVGVWACPDTTFHLLWVSQLAFASSRLLHKWPGDKSRYNRAAGDPLILWASVWGQT